MNKENCALKLVDEIILNLTVLIQVLYKNNNSSRSCRHLQLYIASGCAMTRKMGKNAEVM